MPAPPPPSFSQSSDALRGLDAGLGLASLTRRVVAAAWQKKVGSVLGGFFALLSAAAFAFNNASVRRGVLTGSVAQAMAITVPIGVPLFFIAAAATGQLGVLGTLTPSAAVSLALAGIIHFVVGRYCNYRAIRAIGVNLATPVQQFGLVVALGLAMAALDEKMTPLHGLGIVLVVLGPALTRERPASRVERSPHAMRNKSKPTAPTGAAGAPGAFEPRYAEGYLFAILSACAYGTSPVFIRAGLADLGFGGSFAGGLVSYAAALAAFALVLLVPGQIAHLRSIDRTSATWFTITGVTVSVSQMFYYMALAIAPVSVVAPILRLSLVFRVYFARWLTPDHEVFGARIMAATAVSFAGALLLTVSTDWVAGLLPLPDAVAAALRWRWP